MCVVWASIKLPRLTIKPLIPPPLTTTHVPMGIVLGVFAIGELIADAISAAAAVTATISETVAFAVAMAIPELDITGISSIAGVIMDTGADAVIDEGTSIILKAGARVIAENVIKKMAEKGVEKSYSNMLKIYTKAYEHAEGTAKKIKNVHLAADAALNTCCLPKSGCSVPLNLKCASTSGSLRVGGAGLLRAGVSSTTLPGWPRSLNHLGANTKLTFPMTQICGGSKKSVGSLAEALHCYEETLRNLQLKVEMSESWRSVSEHECNVILFGATTNISDGYCTVFPVAKSGATLNGSYYTETPHCETMEIAVKSMLLASKTFPPDGLLPYIWAPSASCELDRAGIRVSHILPPIPMPTPTEAVPTIALLASIGTALLIIGFITTLMHRHTHNILAKLGRKKGETCPLTTSSGVPSMAGLYATSY